MAAQISRRMEVSKHGSMLAFAGRDYGSGSLIGMTTYMNVDAVNKRLKIGSTWNAALSQPNGTNRQS